MKIYHHFLILAAVIAGGVVASAPAFAQLTLNVNRDTGATSITNSTGSAVDIDGYSIESANGLLNPSGWSSFDAQAEPGWQEVDVKTANALGELNGNGSKSLADTSTSAIGSAYTTSSAAVDTAMAAVGFGNGFQDLVFEYNAVGSAAAEFGNVVYTGTERFNNLVLDVDPVSGSVSLTNESSLAVVIDAYSITSVEGMLSVGWNGLRDTESEWVGGNPGSSDTPSGLAEFTTSESFSVAAGASFDLGNVFNPAFNPATNPAVDPGDLDLQFEFLIVGEEPFETGVVRYNLAAGENADFNGDSDVDGSDFLTWQRGFGTGTTLADGDANGSGSVDGTDLGIWELQYAGGALSASVAAVPEPATLALVMFTLCCSAASRKRQG